LIPDIYSAHKGFPWKFLRLAPTRWQVPVLQTQSLQKYDPDLESSPSSMICPICPNKAGIF
jgi:hypothetical protein